MQPCWASKCLKRSKVQFVCFIVAAYDFERVEPLIFLNFLKEHEIS
jgi:hypothetical protein